MNSEARETAHSSVEDPSGQTVRSHGLSRTLLTWFVLLPVTSLVLAGVVITIIVMQDARQSVAGRLSAIATLKESEINGWVASQQAELALIAVTPDVRDKLLYVLKAKTRDSLVAATEQQLQEYFTVLTRQGQSFEELFLLDTSGVVHLSTDPTQVGQSHAEHAYFVQGREGPYVNPPYYSASTAAPALVVAHPLQDANGQVHGVLAGRLNPRQIDNIMQETAGLDKTGETYLLTLDGLLLTSPRRGPELARGQALVTQGVALAQALDDQDERPNWAIYDNYAGRMVLGTYRRMPDLQMLLLAEQEMSETVALTRDILLISLAALLLAAGVAAGIAILVSRRITHPLEALTGSAHLLATGDLSHQVPGTERQDEIGRLAWAFDQMSQQLRDLITRLEKQVAERTRQLQDANYKLQRRAIQLESIALVGHAVISILNLDDLLLEVVNLICARFDFYHAGIFLIDESGNWAVLRQATGEVGQRMLARQHRLEVGGQSIVGWAAAQRQARVALDVGADAVHFKNPDLPPTHSEMALPLIVGDRLLGVLDVQSTEEAAFDEDDVAILSLMADQVAVAIDNALKFSQESAILEATSPLYHVSRSIVLATSLEDVLQSIVDYAAGPHVDRCAIQVYADADEGHESAWCEVAAMWDRAVPPPDPQGTRYTVEGAGLLRYFRDEPARTFVVNDLLDEVADERLDDETRHILGTRLHLRALMAIPLAVRGRPTGLLLIGSRQPHAWTEDEQRTFRSLGDHTAAAVQNAHLFQQIQTASMRERQVNRITEKIRGTFDMEAILKAALLELREATGAADAFAYLARTPTATSGRPAHAVPDGRANSYDRFDRGSGQS
jgi:GAF domain-containing protein/HAMP domain-containing protein